MYGNGLECGSRSCRFCMFARCQWHTKAVAAATALQIGDRHVFFELRIDGRAISLVISFVKRLLLAILVSTAASAQDLSTFEKFLVPVLNQSQPIVGANGSLFRTSFGALTADLQPITFYPTGPSPHVGESYEHILEVPVWEAPVVAKGRFVFIERNGLNPTLFAKVASVAADGSSAETPLPVVSESSALTGMSTFGVLPNDAMYSDALAPGANSFLFLGYRQRHTLRVYDFGSGGGEVEVRLVYAWWLIRGTIAARRLSLSSRDFDDVSYPYYAEANLQQLFGTDWCYPTLRGTGCSSLEAIVQVVPLTPGLRYYAFVSTTDNVNNHVALFTPR